MINRSTLGKRIREARVRSGLSQQQLANAVGVSDKTISAYEVGRVDPPLDALDRLSQATQHPITYFLGDVQSNIEARLERIAAELTEIRQALQQSGQKSTTDLNRNSPMTSYLPQDKPLPHPVQSGSDILPDAYSTVSDMSEQE